jgi:WD40 repeat protein
MNCFLKNTLFSALLLSLTACQFESTSEKTWVHDEKGLFDASFSKDGKLALVATLGQPARLIDMATNKPLHEWKHTDDNKGIIASAISANNKFAITAESTSLALWETKSGKIIGYWDFPIITDIAISDNGLRAIIGMEKNMAYYFDLYHGKIIHTFDHGGFVNTVALSNNNQYAITGGNDQYAKLWDLKTGELKHKWRQNFKIYDVAISDDGRYAMSNASLGKSRLWDTQTGEMLSQLPMRYMTISASVFSPDGKTLLTGRPNQRIDLWDVKTGELLNTWLQPKGFLWGNTAAAIIALAFSADGQFFFSEASDGTAKMWKVSRK